MITSPPSHLDWQALSRHGLQPSKIFQSVLFPVDFSDPCKMAAAYVRDLAEFTGGRVTLLHVVPRRPAWYGAADVDSGTDGYETWRTLKKVRMSALMTFRDEYFNGVPCQIRIEWGSVAEQILDYAEHSGADLIMIPTRGASKSGRPLLGSVTARVLQDAPCAVWTSPHSDKLQPFTGFSSIVCAIAPNATLGEYVNGATGFAAVFGSRVAFASAIAPAKAVQEYPRVLTLEEEYPLIGSKCPVYVEPGPVGYVVRHVAQIQSADLVLINRRHVPQCFGTFETHAYEIILESPCPVLRLPIKATSAPNNIVGKIEAQQERVFAQASC
jgi:nucleotide-binding universal stress UspA family protein